MVLFVECVFSEGFYIALGEVFYDNRGFLLVQYSVEASPLLITLTRKTLSSWFLEDRLSVFSIFSVLELKLRRPPFLRGGFRSAAACRCRIEA